MNEEESLAEKSNESHEGTLPISESQPQSRVPTQQTSEADLTEVKKDLADAEKKMNGFERSTLRWTRASFVVIFFTGLFIALQWREMRNGGIDTHKLAEAAKKQVDLAWLNIESTQAASFKIDHIDPVQDDYWRVFTVNFGKAIAPTLDFSYSIVHQSFPDGKIIDTSGPYFIHRADVLPSDPTRGTDVVFDFETPGYGRKDKRLTSAEETFIIKGKFSYINGFDRPVEEPF
jgi:hypothetical protein